MPSLRHGLRHLLLVPCLLAVPLSGCVGDGSTVRPSERASAPQTGAASAAPSATSLPPAAQAQLDCPSAKARPFTLRAGHEEITGYRLGTGHRVVVLTHQSRGTPCDLAALGSALAASGYRVVAWTGENGADEPGLRLLVAHERRKGASFVALVGASLGAATSLTAAARISPRVDAVILLSASSQSSRAGDVTRAAAGYRGPLMAVAGEFDPSFAHLLPELRSAHSGPEDIAEITGSSDHGKDFVSQQTAPMVARIEAFLSR